MPNSREIPKHYLRKPPILDDQILAAVKSAGGLGHFDDKGLYTTFKLSGFETFEQAHEYQQSVYRCAKYMSESKRAPLPGGWKLSVAVKKKLQPNGTYTLECSIYDKASAKQRMIDRYGPDIENWPYSPYKFKNHKNYGV